MAKKRNFVNRLELYQKIKNFLIKVIKENNSVFNIIDLANCLDRGIQTIRRDIDFVCFREGFKLKALGLYGDRDTKSSNQKLFQVIKL